MSHDGARSSQFTDTSDRAKKRYAERLRQTTPSEKLKRTLMLSERARSAALRSVREQNPGASETELKVEFIRRVDGEELARRLAAHMLSLGNEISDRQWGDVLGG